MDWMIGMVVGVAIVIVIARAAGSNKAPQSRAAVRPTASGRASSPGAPAQPAPPASGSVSASAGRSRSRQAFPITWFGPDADLEVAGIRLKSPCVYASTGVKAGYLWATDPSEILLQAPVHRPSGPAGEMGYWPWYARIEPGHRYEYLSWLASGRTALPPNEGYVFLYFYGIERRLLIDEADRAWGLQEVVRLCRLDQPRVATQEGRSCQENGSSALDSDTRRATYQRRSFRRYSTGLLWFEIARTPNLFDQKAFDLVVGLTERWTPELLTAPLGWLAAKERPLPAGLARQIAAADPASQRSVVLKRVKAEFEELFDARYREAFGDEGMTLRVSKRLAWHTYRPASGGLSEVRCSVVNPLGIRSQFKKLPEIWNSCVADLRRLSRVAATTTEGSLTVETWEAMPPELRAEVDHPLTDPVSAILTDAAPPSADESEARPEPAMVPAGRFAALIGIERRPTLTATQSQKLAATIEYTGYGLVPDARVSSVRYGWDDLVAVVPGLDDDDVEPTRYNAAACVLRLGLSVAQADGEADEVELRMLTDHIDAVFDLSPEEQQRLAALRDLLLKTGSDIRPIARKIETMLPPDGRRKVGRLIVVIAAATNGIDRSERAALRKAFRALGLPPELLEETIAEVAPQSDEAEVRVRAATAGAQAGEAIPARHAPGFRLNHEAISSIMAETREVSVMLAAAMGAAEAEAPPASAALAEPPAPDPMVEAISTTAPVGPSASAPVAEIAGPGGRYEPLFMALIDRDRWSRDDADRLARSHGLMLDAGVEAINDWAYDALGAPLIEDEGDELALDRSLLGDSV